MNTEIWAGQSLGFIRKLTGQPPVYASCRDAIRETDLRQGEPPMGAYVWFDNEPYGDVGLALGNGEMLAISSGRPVVAKIIHWHHVSCGWSTRIGDENATKKRRGAQ